MEGPYNHLIVVCGHGIWLGGPAKGQDESEWLIEDYKKGETPTFIEHIKAGVKAFSEDDQSVLVFSGGPTRKETRMSEGESYRQLAQVNNYFGLLPNGVPADRILAEDRALDSYYNILFSLILVWRVHRVWPAYMTIVSHAFKKRRLVDLHCNAIAFPTHRVRFIGVDPPNVKKWYAADHQMTEESWKVLEGVKAAEREWERDPHGRGPAGDLPRKRKERNVWDVDQGLFENPAVRDSSGLRTERDEYDVEHLDVEAARPW